MLKIIRNISILVAVILISYFSYEALSHDSSIQWKSFTEPQLASFTSLDEDQKILTELRRQTMFGSYKPLDPRYFVKANIFKTVEKR